MKWECGNVMAQVMHSGDRHAAWWHSPRSKTSLATTTRRMGRMKRKDTMLPYATNY